MSASLQKFVDMRIEIAGEASDKGNALKDPGELAHIARRVTNGDYAIDDGRPQIGIFGNIVAMVKALKEHIDNAQRESERATEESKNAREP